MTPKKLPTNPIGVVLRLAGAKWKMLIISELLKSELGFAELKKKLKCTSKVLISCLQEMEEDGLIIREELSQKPLRVLYYLTDIGFTMKPVIDSMYKWGSEYKKLRKLMDEYSESR